MKNILITAATLCLSALSAFGWIAQSEIDITVSTNASGTVTNGVSTQGYFLRIVARIPAGLGSANVAFVNSDDGSTLLATNTGASVSASGFGSTDYNGTYSYQGTYNGQALYRLDDSHWLWWDGNIWRLGTVAGGVADQIFYSSNTASLTGGWNITFGDIPAGIVASHATTVRLWDNLNTIHGAYSVITSAGSGASNTTLRLLLLEDR